jgi:hypothetical protein
MGINTEELWKDILDCGTYQVSNLGNVRSLNYKGWGFIKNLQPIPQGKEYNKPYPYLGIGLFVNGKQKQFRIHRLVMQAFNGESLLHIDHINGNKSDNRLENLRYVTNRQNKLYAIEKTNKYPGVYFNKNRYVARIRVGKERLELGRFKTPEEAVKTYNDKLKEITNGSQT